MSTGFASRILFLYLLIMCVRKSGAREMTEKQWRELSDHNHINIQLKMQEPEGNIILRHPTDDDVPIGNNVIRLLSMDSDSKVHDSDQRVINDHKRTYAEQDNDVHQDKHRKAPLHGHSSSHMNHMDPQLLVFFTMKDLKEGTKMAIYFPKRDPSTSPHLLPREDADSIPFSSKELPYLLQFFSFSHGSPQAKAMEDTLRQCEISPIQGETKFCTTSLESMLDFARGIFGLESHFEVLSTTHLTKSTTLFQNYTILKVPKEISAPKMVACHSMPYPYALFYCHSQESKNKVFKVSLGGENGDSVEAVAVCHTDTSQWSRDHVSFRVLGIEPGTSTVCHFFPADNFIFVPTPTLV